MYKLGIPNGCWDMLGIQVVLKASVKCPSQENSHTMELTAAGKQCSCDRLHRHRRSPPLPVRLNENEELPATAVIMKGDAVHQSDNVHNSPLLSTTFLYRILFVKAMEVKMFHAFWRVEARLRNKTDFWTMIFGNQKDIPQFLPHCTLWLGVIHLLWQNWDCGHIMD